MTAQQALDYGFVDYVDGLTKSEEVNVLTEEPEAHTDDSGESEEQSGIVNKVLSFVGLQSKGEIIHRPDEENSSEITELQNKLDAKDVELANVRNMFALKEAELEAQKAQHEEAVNELKAEYNNKLNELENCIKAEVHNRIAALGLDSNELPAPASANNSLNLAATVKTSGLEAALRAMKH